jgi:hypothetical protein
MSVNSLLASLFTEQAVRQNVVTDIAITDAVITISLEPKVAAQYERPDCQQPVSVQLHDSEIIRVQGLGAQGRAVRYLVKTVRVAYTNDQGKFVTFTVPLPGIRTDLLVTDEVVEKALYLIVDRNLSLPVAAEMLHDLYQVHTSSSALERWKTSEAARLPSIGRIIQRLNEKKG